MDFDDVIKLTLGNSILTGLVLEKCMEMSSKSKSKTMIMEALKKNPTPGEIGFTVLIMDPDGDAVVDLDDIFSDKRGRMSSASVTVHGEAAQGGAKEVRGEQVPPGTLDVNWGTPGEGYEEPS